MDTNVSDGGFSISIDNKEVVSVRVSVGSYSSASISVSPNKNEYCDIYYEWSGDEGIPTFVLEVLSFIKKKNEKASLDIKDGFVYKNEELYKDYLEFKKRGE